jgi:hypothetical protein
MRVHVLPVSRAYDVLELAFVYCSRILYNESSQTRTYRRPSTPFPTAPKNIQHSKNAAQLTPRLTTLNTMVQTSKEKELNRKKRMSEDKEYEHKRKLQRKIIDTKHNKTPRRIQSQHKRYLARSKGIVAQRQHPVSDILPGYIPVAVAEEILRPDMASFTPTPTPSQLLLVTSQQSYSPTAEQHLRAASATKKLGADSIDGCAAMLASVDKRSYSRALLRDADAILEKVIFPMSFPWTHRLETQSRIIPHDIDEMPGVRAAEAVDQFKGEIEDIPLSRKSLMPPSKRDDSEDDDTNIPGELSFRMFQEVQARKRQRIDLELVDNETKTVSARIGSTVPTHLPHHVQYGRQMLLFSVSKDSLLQ